MCVCVNAQTHARTHATHTHTHTHTHSHKHTCICIYIYNPIYMYIDTYTDIWVQGLGPAHPFDATHQEAGAKLNALNR